MTIPHNNYYGWAAAFSQQAERLKKLKDNTEIELESEKTHMLQKLNCSQQPPDITDSINSLVELMKKELNHAESYDELQAFIQLAKQYNTLLDLHSNVQDENFNANKQKLISEMTFTHQNIERIVHSTHDAKKMLFACLATLAILFTGMITAVAIAPPLGLIAFAFFAPFLIAGLKAKWDEKKITSHTVIASENLLRKFSPDHPEFKSHYSWTLIFSPFTNTPKIKSTNSPKVKLA